MQALLDLDISIQSSNVPLKRAPIYILPPIHYFFDLLAYY